MGLADDGLSVGAFIRINPDIRISVATPNTKLPTYLSAARAPAHLPTYLILSTLPLFRFPAVCPMFVFFFFICHLFYYYYAYQPMKSANYPLADKNSVQLMCHWPAIGLLITINTFNHKMQCMYSWSAVPPAYTILKWLPEIIKCLYSWWIITTL